jgi:hypothetical protein
MTKEMKLRIGVRKAIKKYFYAFQKTQDPLIERVLEEHNLRIKLREVILEAAAEGPAVDIHDNTGINTLKDLLKNTNILSTLRGIYKTLTTNESQRLSFRAHIIKWIQDTLAPITINDDAPELTKEAIDDDIGIDITQPGEGDEDKFIEADDGSPADDTAGIEDPEENEMTAITGEDATGRNKAERTYPVIEKSIIDFYGELDNDEDQELFYDYLIANIKLYFDKWEGEMSHEVEEPTNAAYDAAAGDIGAPQEASAEEISAAAE